MTVLDQPASKTPYLLPMPCFFFEGGEVLRTRRKLFLKRPMITIDGHRLPQIIAGHAWSPNRQPGAILAVLQERRAQFIYSARAVDGPYVRC